MTTYKIGTGHVSETDPRPALLIWPRRKGGFFTIPLEDARTFADAIVDTAEEYERDTRVQIDPDGIIRSLQGLTEKEAWHVLLRRRYNSLTTRPADAPDLPHKPQGSTQAELEDPTITE